MASRHRHEAASDGSFVLRVRRVRSGEQLHVKVLTDVTDRIMGLLYHWKGPKKNGESVPCLPGCPLSLHNSGTFWHGYLAAEVWVEPKGPWMPCVFEVTEALELDMRGKVRRGQTWLVQRVVDEKGRSAAVTGVLTEELAPHAVPLSFSVLPVVWSIYHNTHVELETPNHLADRVYVRPIEAPPPKVLQAEGRHAPATEAELAEFRAKLRDRGLGQIHSRNGQQKDG